MASRYTNSASNAPATVGFGGVRSSTCWLAGVPVSEYLPTHNGSKPARRGIRELLLEHARLDQVMNEAHVLGPPDDVAAVIVR